MGGWAGWAEGPARLRGGSRAWAAGPAAPQPGVGRAGERCPRSAPPSPPAAAEPGGERHRCPVHGSRVAAVGAVTVRRGLEALGGAAAVEPRAAGPCGAK